MTKKDLLEAIKDMPMDARILMYVEDPEYGGDVWVDGIYIETSIGRRDRGTIMIKEKRAKVLLQKVQENRTSRYVEK